MNDSRPGSRRRAVVYFAFGALATLAAALLLVQLFARQKAKVQAATEQQATVANAGPMIEVAIATRASGEDQLALLGEARPFQSATIYAKVSGYLRQMNVDKGDRVRANQLMAVIESPEVDKQYQAAVADAENKKLNAQRDATLVKQQMISQQDADQAETDAKVAQANLEALATMKAYEELRAPFDGTVTARFADPGALIQNAANSQTSAQPVVAIAQTDRLRVYAYVDQAHAAYINPGDPAIITDPARPEVRIAARVARTSGEIDEKTRTLLAEIDLDNPRNRILAGSFVQVQLAVRTPRYVEVPSDCLIVHGDKNLVAVVGSDNRVHLRPVVVVDHTGEKVRVLSGVSEGERVARSLGDAVPDGALVRPSSSGTAAVHAGS